MGTRIVIGGAWWVLPFGRLYETGAHEMADNIAGFVVEKRDNVNESSDCFRHQPRRVIHKSTGTF
jgi:hypothetical protein